MNTLRFSYSNTILFWVFDADRSVSKYDTRLGRRWNVDPVVKEYESPYAAFGNSPRSVTDWNGDDSIGMNNTTSTIKKGNDYQDSDGSWHKASANSGEVVANKIDKSNESINKEINETIDQVSKYYDKATIVPSTLLSITFQKGIRKATEVMTDRPTMAELRVMVKAAKPIGNALKIVSGVATALTYVSTTSEYEATGKLKNSTTIYVSVTTILAVGSAIPIPIVQQASWISGAVYGLTRAIAGDEIDQAIDGDDNNSSK